VKNYESLEHTADIYIRVEAKDLEELFRKTALAMFDIMAQPNPKAVLRREKVSVTQQADTLEDLFVGWLNELLSLSATKDLIFSDFTIASFDRQNIQAEAFGSSFKDFTIDKEIKAATYHALQIKETQQGWLAEVIFDV
jgi:SHS2 domain-containing protein